VSSSLLDEQRFRKIWTNAKILPFGHPRNDILFDKKTDYHKIICQHFNIDLDTKLALYAPTFRGDGDGATDLSAFLKSFDKFQKICEKKFGGKWKILIRMHHKNKAILLNNIPSSSILDATNYPDMQELIAGCNIGVSDYSSWIACMLMIKKPMFIFAKDYNEYKKSRGLSFSLESMPLTISKSENELFNSIINFNPKKYESSVANYLQKNKFYDDGFASKRIADFISSKLNFNDIPVIKTSVSKKRKIINKIKKVFPKSFVNLVHKLKNR
jgi:CDP-glycerol glycerophosphotransferase